ncbi:peptidase M48 Ste24p [Thermodesulfobium narugense DSM 14796]|uniref:Peptidase M48 Ste24p n=1 Tax=Thermodesulfobium narugense DSM 14796 TaxID=747365 RepID=M1E4Q0_9BACT|nr:M48 family metallopeptidase [Thermodesulfobium narugense]AEE14392.1 peptidase M48 Ste24p [Thermodesulfobium narugense DSM 14796]
MKRRSFLIVFFGFASSLILPKKASASLISTQEEIKIGRDASKSFEKKYGLYTDQYWNQKVSEIGSRLVAVCDRKDLPYSFKIVNINQVNAVSFPGGFIYVYKGLLNFVKSNDELACVLGHEIGHVCRRHVVKNIEREFYANLLLQIFLAKSSSLTQYIAGLTENLVMLGYSREEEYEADHYGTIYAYRAGYNPCAMITFMERLKTLEKDNFGKAYEIFSDHPATDERIKRLQELDRELGVQCNMV